MLLLAAPLCGLAGAATPESPPASEPSTGAPVVVTARKLSVETLIDRKVYSVATNVQSTFGTVTDILSVIPSVDVDADGAVSLRGDTNVLILIDGKPSAQLSGSTAGDALQSIPASDIERIEIITTPPAQFRAEGAAGVINIITRKKRPRGISGTVHASLGSGGRSVVGASTSYSSGRLTASASAGYRQDYRERVLQSDVLASDPVTGQVLDSTSSLNERIRRSVPTVGFSAEYALSDARTVSAAANWNERGGLRTYSQFDQSRTPSGLVTSSSERLSAGRDPESADDVLLGFSQKLDRAGEKLDFTLHRSTSRQRERYDYTHDSFVPPAAPFYDNLSFIEDHATTEFDADYVLPFAKTRSVKFGYAFEQDDFRFDNAGNNVDPVTGLQVVDPSLTNGFKFRQRINSAYASFQTTAASWTWLAGLRTELTRTDAQQLTDNLSTGRSYVRLYPSLHVERSLTDASTLSFGASRRVSRPDPSNLNPYVDHEYAPNLRSGNADLRPQYTQSYEIGYGYEARALTYALTGYYRRNRDSVTDVTEYLGNGLSLTTKANLPKNDSAGIELSSNGHLVPALAYGISANLFYSQIDATALGVPGLQSTKGVNAKLKFDYRPTAVDSAQIALNRTDKRLTPQGFVSAVNIVNLGYKHQLKPDLTAIATVSDVFNGQRLQRIAMTPTLTEEYSRSVRGRVLYVGLVYTFGSQKKDKQATFEYDQSN